MTLPTLDELLETPFRTLARRSKAERDGIARLAFEALRQHAQENQLAHYWPVNREARALHLSTAPEVGIQAGFKAGKTGTAVAEAAIQMTGIVPACLDQDYPREKLRPPIRVRLVVTQLEQAWDKNLKQKFQWFHWNGDLNADKLPGDPARGHWGFIPRRFLIGGDWDRSWSEGHRILTLNRGGDFGTEPGSTLEVMAHPQSIKEFNQGAYHLVLEDEIPPEEIHRANVNRIIEFGGQVVTSGTPSDEEHQSVPQAWFFDRVLVPGLAGSDPASVFAIRMNTLDNRTMRQERLAQLAKGLTEQQKRVRFGGEFLHLEGLIFPGVTERARIWCFRCVLAVLPVEGRCPSCGGTDLVAYCHAWDDRDLGWPGPVEWPTLFYMDPHQSKATCCLWIKVDPRDQWWQIAEQEIAGNAATVRREVEAFEAQHRLTVLWRKGDPKITAQTNQFAQEFEGREFTIREAFEEAGFGFEDANTNFTVGRERLLAALQPSAFTRAPRLRIHRGCVKTLYQMTHFVWDKTGRPSKKDSDFPAALRYFVMDEPTWRDLAMFRHPRTLRIGGRGTGRGVTGW